MSGGAQRGEPALERPVGVATAAGVIAAYRAERRKLLAQPATRALALICLLGPPAFAGVLGQQNGVPADTLLGVWVHASGYAVSFVVLGFAGYLGFPIIAGALAGDLFSCEDRYGTWKTILTRSSTRGAVFAGKLLAAATAAVCLVIVAAVSSLLAGLLFTGDQPLVGFGGNALSSSECLWLTAASWVLSIPPMLAYVSVAALLSILTRNGIAGVLGTVLVGLATQLLDLIGRGSWVHTALAGSAFDDWHGLLSAPRFYSATIIGSLVSLAWVLVCVAASWLLLSRRDFAGPPVARRPGWLVPIRAVTVAGVLLGALALATNLGPVAITKARLEASIAPLFGNLTLLQQRELGRAAPRGAKLRLRANCARHAGKSQGPGDDWSCTLTVVTPVPGSEPFSLTAVDYDVSVKSNGCYKADSPPSLVGGQSITDVHGDSVVNPLSTLYGCFDTLASPRLCGEAGSCLIGPSIRTPAGPISNPPEPAAQRRSELQALRQAERRAGPKVMREIEEAEKAERHSAELEGEQSGAGTGSG